MDIFFPTPCPWITTPLTAGPLAGNTYNSTISCAPATPVSASTIYEYRAYSVINGVTYYGNILTGCTEGIVTTAPIVSGGSATCIATNCMRIVNNYVCDKGGLPVAEYGILYTQIASYGNSGCMVYDAVPSKMCKRYITADIGIGTGNTFFSTSDSYSLTGLSENTTTYYRAFAKNSTGVGYGTIKTAQTTSPIYVSISDWAQTQSGSNSAWCAKLTTTPALTAGQGFCLTYLAEATSAPLEMLTHVINACACVMRNTVTCGCANTSAPVGSPGEYDTATDTIIINNTSTSCVSQYTICVKALSSTADYSSEFCNYGRIMLTGISDCCNTPDGVCFGDIKEIWANSPKSSFTSQGGPVLSP